MNINYFDCGFPYILIDDFYNKEEQDLIWEELNFLSYEHKLKSPKETGAAYIPADHSDSEEEVVLKNNKGLFLEDVYNNKECSNILKVNKKLFDIDLTKHGSWFFQNITETMTKSTNLISYYEDNDEEKSYYAPHRDISLVTCLTWFYKGTSKKFKGGDLYFPDYDNKCVEVKYNRVILFPSFIRHAVDNVVVEECFKRRYMGRYCLTTFMCLPNG